MAIFSQKAEKTTSLKDLEDRLRQVEEMGNALLSLSTREFAGGTFFDIATFKDEPASGGALELITEPEGMSDERERLFFSSLEAQGSSFVTAATIFIEGELQRVVACRAGSVVVTPPIATPKPLSTRPFTTPETKARGEHGSSQTSGLQGTLVIMSDGTEITDATEEIAAERDGRALGSTRSVRQIRTRQNGRTRVSQPGYAWAKRDLPDAELVEVHSGFAAASNVLEGRSTFFGKGDGTDEGTGSPAYGVVQTNSSVFGVSLRSEILLEHGLVRRTEDGWVATAEGTRAIIEVFYPATKRMARLPLVDIGPGTNDEASGASGPRKRIIDLTAAAVAFLQGVPETEMKKLDNLDVQARIVV